MPVRCDHPRELAHALARAGFLVTGVHGSLDGRPLAPSGGDLVLRATLP